MPLPDLPEMAPPTRQAKLKQLIDGAFPPVRPLDPNGIDVPAEIPIMQRAFATTANGMANNRRAEAGYRIFRSGTGVGHAGFYHGDSAEVKVPITKDTIAIAHTHPLAGEFTPSPGDMDSPVPNYVFSGDQLYATVPGKHRYNKYDIDKWNIPGVGMAARTRPLKSEDSGPMPPQTRSRK